MDLSTLTAGACDDDAQASDLSSALTSDFASGDISPVRYLDTASAPAAAVAPAGPGFLGQLKSGLGAVQSAIVAPVQAAGAKAAKSAGASDSTADTLGGFTPWVIVAAVVALVVYLARRGGGHSSVHL